MSLELSIQESYAWGGQRFYLSRHSGNGELRRNDMIAGRHAVKYLVLF